PRRPAEGHHDAPGDVPLYDSRIAALAFRFGCTQQVDSNHKSSKLLRAKPTATAIWPAFCSIKSADVPSAGGMIFSNGLEISTGNENSWRSASTNPGTLEEPPAR